ncbi:MAG: hypothetical protein ACE5Q3_09590, partial [Alphaproteobacteria bacterium]
MGASAPACRARTRAHDQLDYLIRIVRKYRLSAKPAWRNIALRRDFGVAASEEQAMSYFEMKSWFDL